MRTKNTSENRWFRTSSEPEGEGRPVLWFRPLRGNQEPISVQKLVLGGIKISGTGTTTEQAGTTALVLSPKGEYRAGRYYLWGTSKAPSRPPRLDASGQSENVEHNPNTVVTMPNSKRTKALKGLFFNVILTPEAGKRTKRRPGDAFPTPLGFTRKDRVSAAGADPDAGTWPERANPGLRAASLAPGLPSGASPFASACQGRALRRGGLAVQSSRWQAAASLPEKDFRRHVAEVKTKQSSKRAALPSGFSGSGRGPSSKVAPPTFSGVRHE